MAVCKGWQCKTKAGRDRQVVLSSQRKPKWRAGRPRYRTGAQRPHTQKNPNSKSWPRPSNSACFPQCLAMSSLSPHIQCCFNFDNFTHVYNILQLCSPVTLFSAHFFTTNLPPTSACMHGGRYKSYAGSCGRCVFMIATVALHPEDRIAKHSSLDFDLEASHSSTPPTHKHPPQPISKLQMSLAC